MATKKKTSKPLHLTLHELITALSYWGSAVRLLLFGFLATLTLFVGLAETGQPTNEVGLYIYVMATYFLFDVGYVMLARGLPLMATTDKLVVFLGGTVMAALYMLPYFAMVPTAFVWVLSWALVVVFGILSLRALIGLLYGR